MSMGCCGNRVSLAGLLADADFYPARSREGQVARRRLVYGIAAGQAARVGNRGAYERALKGLAELGTTYPSGTGYHATTADAAAATAAFQTIVTQTRTRVASQLAEAGTYINLVLGAAQLGTGIAAAACNGCDRTGIDATNLVISVIRSIITPGSSLTVPTLSVDTLNGLVGFCAFKDAIKGILQAAFAAGVTAASLARNAGAVTALNTIQGFLTNLIDAICNIPQVQMAMTTPTSPPNCAASIPNSTWNTATNQCECLPGYSSAITPGQCVPSTYRPTSPLFTRPTTPLPITSPPASSGSKAWLAIPAAAALWWFF